MSAPSASKASEPSGASPPPPTPSAPPPPKGAEEVAKEAAPKEGELKQADEKLKAEEKAEKKEPAAKQEDKGDKKAEDPTTATGVIDMEVFGQILEMDDDDDDRDFSHGIVINFFEQATATFKEMDDALAACDLKQLHTKGHFLKGSSAALGLIKVKASCEAIQNLGKLKDRTGTRDIPRDEALSHVKDVVERVQGEYKEAEAWLEAFYAEAAE